MPPPLVSRRRALSAGSCRWSRSRGNGRSRRIPDLLHTPQKDLGSDGPEWPAHRVFCGTADDRPGASPESVRPDTDEQGDCLDQKGLQMQAFCEAAEGIRTLDLLHGKRNVGSRASQEKSCKMPVSELHAISDAFQLMPRNRGGFRTETGLRTVSIGPTSALTDGGLTCRLTLRARGGAMVPLLLLLRVEQPAPPNRQPAVLLVRSSELYG